MLIFWPIFDRFFSQFELNYWNKWTFPQHSNLLRCTCISIKHFFGGGECTALFSTVNTTTEVPFSKALNPQLFPGRCNINGCPLLRVCVCTLWMGLMQSTNSDYGSPYLAVCHVTKILNYNVSIHPCDLNNRVGWTLLLTRRCNHWYLFFINQSWVYCLHIFVHSPNLKLLELILCAHRTFGSICTNWT